MPPREASVTEVADTYLQAVAAKNCETVQALTLTGAWQRCGDPVLLAHHRDGKITTLPGSGGSRAVCVPYTINTDGS